MVLRVKFLEVQGAETGEVIPDFGLHVIYLDPRRD